MSLSEFKTIYFWEYGHRMYGRFIGLAFTLPLIYYSIRRYIPLQLYKRLGVLFALGASQGILYILYGSFASNTTIIVYIV